MQQESQMPVLSALVPAAGVSLAVPDGRANGTITPPRGPKPVSASPRRTSSGLLPQKVPQQLYQDVWNAENRAEGPSGINQDHHLEGPHPNDNGSLYGSDDGENSPRPDQVDTQMWRESKAAGRVMAWLSSNNDSKTAKKAQKQAAERLEKQEARELEAKARQRALPSFAKQGNGILSPPPAAAVTGPALFHSHAPHAQGGLTGAFGPTASAVAQGSTAGAPPPLLPSSAQTLMQGFSVQEQAMMVQWSTLLRVQLVTIVSLARTGQLHEFTEKRMAQLQGAGILPATAEQQALAQSQAQAKEDDTPQAVESISPFEMALQGKEADLQARIEEGLAHSNLADESGYTLTHWACFGGHVQIVRMLINKGAWLRARSNNGTTIMHSAAKGGHVTVAEELHSRQVDLNSTSSDGSTPAHEAAFNGHLTMLQYLRNSGANLAATGNNGGSVAHSAAMGGHVHVLEYLSQIGVDLNATAADGASVALWTAISGSYECFKLLQNKGIDVKRSSKDGALVTHWCAFRGRLSMLKKLREEGWTMDARTTDGGALIHFAAMGGHTDILEWLLQFGVNIDDVKKDGTTAAFWAAYCGKRNVLDWLEKNDADLLAKGKNGGTVAHAAAYGGHLRCIQWLFDQGYSLHAVANNGGTLAHWAAYGGHLNVLKFLEANGVDLRSKGHNGGSALDMALYAGHSRVVEYLKSYRRKLRRFEAEVKAERAAWVMPEEMPEYDE